MISRHLAVRVVVVMMLVGVVCAAAGQGFAQPAQQPAAPPGVEQAQPQGDFVPVKDLPARQEQLPAAPLVMAAYAFVWVALLVYVWTLWRRVGAVQRELTDLRRRAERKA